jgi:uncharacterized protein (TIGR03083 family)
MTDEELAADTPSPVGMVPYATFMEVRIMDCWTHEQDIRRAIGRPGHLEGAAPETAIGRLVSSLGYVVGKRVGPPEGSTVVLDLTGQRAGQLAGQLAGHRTLAVGMRDGRARPTDPPADPTVRITTDPETYACLAAGRWTADHAVAAGRVTFTGDEALGRRVVDNLSIVP